MSLHSLRQVGFIAALCVSTIVCAAAAPNVEEKEVLRVEDAFRQAKLRNDVGALGRIVADDFKGLNQWGSRRDKAELITLFRTFRTEALSNSEVTVRFSGDTAIVDGVMSETNPGGSPSKMLFSRVYVKREGRWLLWSSVQMAPRPLPTP